MKLTKNNILLLLVASFFISSCGVSKSLKDTPNLQAFKQNINTKKTEINDSTFVIGNNQLRKNSEGLYELYVSGNPFERGLITGSLTQKLLQKQEKIFFSKIEELIPSKTKQYLLRKFLAWFNRKSYLHIPNEYKAEIYGVSRFAADDYDYIATDYLRSLYLHGAHDIGHALKDLALVGCSSFAVWNNNTPDGKLLIARNFDFYAGDDFAQNKIISFVKPKNGYKFMSVTWGGMIGVVSGMNDQGLTITINAGKSDIPLTAKAPIALVTREILQYASTIDEAIAIAKKKNVFVSEAILVGSAKDNKAVSIEMSPNNFGVYRVKNTAKLICSNHFQSDAYKNDENNIKQKAESHSAYRYQRMEELLTKNQKITPKIAVDILRNKEGLHNSKIGYGNEKALNQLLAHHGIVFKPSDLKVWVSSNPYQLGAFVCYDLNTVFDKFKSKNYSKPIQNVKNLIKKDDFLQTKTYKNYEEFRNVRRKILDDISKKNNIKISIFEHLKQLNPHYWEPYFLAGKYYYSKGYYTLALTEFEHSLTKEVTTVPDKKKIEKYIKKIKKRI